MENLEKLKVLVLTVESKVFTFNHYIENRPFKNLDYFMVFIFFIDISNTKTTQFSSKFHLPKHVLSLFQ